MKIINCLKCGSERIKWIKIRKAKRLRKAILRECKGGKGYRGRGGEIHFRSGTKKVKSALFKWKRKCLVCKKVF